MALCVTTNALGSVVTTQTETTCTNYLISTAEEHTTFLTAFDQATLALLGIDAETILYCYTWGMGSVLFFWFLGFAIGAVREAIKKL